jgi:hypothetical protein
LNTLLITIPQALFGAEDRLTYCSGILCEKTSLHGFFFDDSGLPLVLPKPEAVREMLTPAYPEMHSHLLPAISENLQA